MTGKGGNEMNMNKNTLKLAGMVLIAFAGTALLVLALYAMTWAPVLLSSVSWNA